MIIQTNKYVTESESYVATIYDNNAGTLWLHRTFAPGKINSYHNAGQDKILLI